MKAQSVFLSYQKSRVHALRFGEGKQLLIAFPGFGDRAELFLNLREALEKKYIVYAIDLPYHGATEWRESTYTPDDLLAITAMILDREKQTSLSLLGFSLGGRLIQKIFPQLEPQLDRIFLVAPDGIHTPSLKWPLLVPGWLRKLLRSALQKPGWLLGFAEVLYRGKMLSKFHRHFVYFHLQDSRRRARLLHTWIAVEHFDLQVGDTRKQWQSTSVSIDLFFGKADRIVSAEAGEELARGLPQVQVHLLEGGHRLIGAALNAQLKKAT